MANNDGIKVTIKGASFGTVLIGGVDVSNYVKRVSMVAVAGQSPTMFVEFNAGVDIECSDITEIQTNLDIIKNGQPEGQPIVK